MINLARHKKKQGSCKLETINYNVIAQFSDHLIALQCQRGGGTIITMDFSSSFSVSCDQESVLMPLWSKCTVTADSLLEKHIQMHLSFLYINPDRKTIEIYSRYIY